MASDVTATGAAAIPANAADPASAATNLPDAADGSLADSADERAPKRRRVSIPLLVTAAGSGIERLHGSDPPAASTASVPDCSRGGGSSHGNEAGNQEQKEQSASTAVSADTRTELQQHPFAQPLSPPLETEPLAGAPDAPSSSEFGLAPKRTYSCRTCGLGLSSASNRLRHERAKHKVQAEPGRRAAVSPSPHSHAPNAPAVPAMREPRKRTAASMYGASARDITQLLQHDEAKDASDSDVENDEELVRFAAAHTTSRRTPSYSAALTPPVTSEDETSDGTPMQEIQGSSGGDSLSTDDTASASEGVVPGMHRLFSDAEMQAGCLPFLEWLTAPPITHSEFLVKARKVTNLTQLQPVKCNLRFVLSLLQSKGLIDTVDLEVFTRLDICRALFDALGDRGCGSARLHALALLVKKVLTFLSSRESTTRRQFLPPTMYESFLFCDATCSDSGQRRKQEARNRALLGIQATQQLLQSHPGYQPSQPFRVPTTWSDGGSSSASSSPASRSAAAKASAHAVGATSASASVPPSSNEMTTAELRQVAKHCLQSLGELMSTSSGDSIDTTTLAVRDRWFMCLIATAILALGLAPRSQVLMQLRLGSTLRKHDDDGLWWVSLLASMSKSGRPVLFALPSELTDPLGYFVATVRPRLLAPASADAPASHDYVFVNRDGSGPRSEFRTCVNLVTQKCLGRSLNPHSFRSAVITAFYDSGASQSELFALSDVMAHDFRTAQACYYRPERSQAALKASEKMKRLLLQAE